MSVPTIQVPCGCVFEAEGEMAIVKVKYCPEGEAAMAGLAEVHSCEDCPETFGSAEELEEHFVLDHLR